VNEMSDEMLMAYADGELDAADCKLVEAYLAANPAGVQRLQAFTRTGRGLGELYAAPMNEPVPSRLIDAVMTTSPFSKRSTAPAGFADRLRSVFEQSFGGPAFWPAVAAVSCGLAVGVATGWNLSGVSLPSGPARSWEQSLVVDTGPAGLIAGQDLRRGLDGTASGTTSKLGNGATAVAMKPVMTFHAKSGAACRQFDLEAPTGQRTAGVGCRQPTGEWRIEILATADAGRAAGTGSGIAPAGRVASPAIDAAVDRLIQGVPLGLEDESKLIGQRWSTGS
jgi:hypothetical protein